MGGASLLSVPTLEPHGPWANVIWISDPGNILEGKVVRVQGDSNSLFGQQDPVGQRLQDLTPHSTTMEIASAFIRVSLTSQSQPFVIKRDKAVIEGLVTISTDTMEGLIYHRTTAI